MTNDLSGKSFELGHSRKHDNSISLSNPCWRPWVVERQFATLVTASSLTWAVKCVVCHHAGERASPDITLTSSIPWAVQRNWHKTSLWLVGQLTTSWHEHVIICYFWSINKLFNIVGCFFFNCHLGYQKCCGCETVIRNLH